MAIALIGSEICPYANSDTSETNSFDTSGANLILSAATTWHFGSVFYTHTPSDSKSNTWSSLTAKNWTHDDNSYMRVQLYYVLAGMVGSGHVFNINNGSSGTQGSNMAGAAFSGVGTYYQSGVGGVNSVGGTTCQPGSVTAPENGCLFVTALHFYREIGSPVAASINSGFTIVEQDAFDDAPSVALAYKIQSTAAAENPVWTHGDGLGGAIAAVTVMAVFRPAGAGQIPRSNRMQQYLVR